MAFIKFSISDSGKRFRYETPLKQICVHVGNDIFIKHATCGVTLLPAGTYVPGTS